GIPGCEQLVREQMDVALPVVPARLRQAAGSLELDQCQRELAAVHPIFLNTSPDLLAVVLGLADVGLAPSSVRGLVPLGDVPVGLPPVEKRGERAAMLCGSPWVPPSAPATELGLPEEGPCLGLP